MGALQNSALLAGDLLNVGLLLYSSSWRHSTLDGLCGFPAPKPHLLLSSLHEVTALETSGSHLTDTHPHSLGDQVLWPWLQNTPPTCHLSHCPYRHHPGSSLQLWLSPGLAGVTISRLSHGQEVPQAPQGSFLPSLLSFCREQPSGVRLFSDFILARGRVGVPTACQRVLIQPCP